MYKFFVSTDAIDEQAQSVVIDGEDYNHIKNVLRMKKGEQFLVSDGKSGRDYSCVLEDFSEDSVICSISSAKDADTELPSKVYLFQGLPKADKMELIIQKAVELGVYEIIPVACHRSVVKLDEKKSDKKIARWQQIAEAAAKQSKRGLIPRISNVMTFKEAAAYAEGAANVRLVPYELADSSGDAMAETRKIFEELKPGQDIAIFIGPEGGFEDKEIELCIEKGIRPITLGKRILRTETAGFTVLSWIVLSIE